MKGELYAVTPQHGHRLRRVFGQRHDNLGIVEGESLHVLRPILVIVAHVLEHVRPDRAVAAFDEQLDEIVGDFILGLHPHPRFGVARIAAALVARRAFEQRDPGAAFGGGDGRREAGDAAPDHHHFQRHNLSLRRRARA